MLRGPINGYNDSYYTERYSEEELVLFPRALIALHQGQRGEYHNQLRKIDLKKGRLNRYQNFLCDVEADNIYNEFHAEMLTKKPYATDFNQKYSAAEINLFNKILDDYDRGLGYAVQAKTDKFDERLRARLKMYCKDILAYKLSLGESIFSDKGVIRFDAANAYERATLKVAFDAIEEQVQKAMQEHKENSKKRFCILS